MRFSKWHALGNSYLVVERAEAAAALGPDDARRLCDLRYGIGADGVLEVVGVEGARAEVAIWNPDGSTAEFSGNGTRIASRWLLARTGGDTVEIAVGDRVFQARDAGGVSVAMAVGTPEVGERERLDVAGEELVLRAVSVGNPHAVVEREQPSREELRRLGPLVEMHPRFPGRTNVQLAARLDGHRVAALVWERGAGETAASGSSAVAVAAAAVANGWSSSPVTVELPGGSLRVDLHDGAATLTGPAVEIARGELV